MPRDESYRDSNPSPEGSGEKGRMQDSDWLQRRRDMFFPDYTFQVQKQRHSFDGVKKALQAKELKYSMLFPAKLCVIAEGKSWYFTSPADVWDWIKGWCQGNRRAREKGKDAHTGTRRQAGSSGPPQDHGAPGEMERSEP
ncbi:hypothetical protein NDU88_001939 [Pleurodeles waltl]|uniref:Uncharacterized protein n=1 Tax=Pleurodeles waltl TaxID=8319 RepID=A0AAV7U9V6_PLEWA|nr:hypothetical protein NDU88_001939 [Pleurodeles waltl]